MQSQTNIPSWSKNFKEVEFCAFGNLYSDSAITVFCNINANILSMIKKHSQINLVKTFVTSNPLPCFM